MNRKEKRKTFRQTSSLVTKAKKDMLDWVETIGRVPSDQEVKAWQSGYIAGTNRINKLIEED
jgi:hypothetical protein